MCSEDDCKSSDAAGTVAIASLRAFVAVHLDSDTRAALAVASADLRAHAAELPVAWVASENFHITVKFLGGIDEARVPAVVEALHTAVTGRHAFGLEIVSLGAFPSPTRPRVLWAGVAEGEAPLVALAAATDDALAAAAARRFGRLTIEHIALMRSDVSPRGARYTALASVPLLR